VQQLVANFLIHELHTFVPTYSFRSYLYRSAYNLWVQDQRREKVRRACSLEHSPEPPSREASVVAELQGKELEAQLEAAWSLLTPQQQRVMRETLNETPNEAIAASLGLTVQAVCMVRWRARTKLRALLGMPAREDCSDGILV
jgi:RNA polymerase sigma factor (sigma-70 family)